MKRGGKFFFSFLWGEQKRGGQQTFYSIYIGGKSMLAAVMNCFRFANVMNNATIINMIAIQLILRQQRQIMTTITDKFLKFELVIKKTLAKNHTFFAVVTFSRINSFIYINSIERQHLSNPFIKS